jgi:hypothetical protein
MQNNILKLTKPMMHGPAVARLQEIGDLLGCDFGPNDGIFGVATQSVVMDLQKKLGITVDGVCGPKTWEAILGAVDEDPLYDVIGIHDRRGLHGHPKLYGRVRSWDDIDGVTLHQTGCKMPLAPKGWDRLNAHIGVTRDGKVILANDPTDMIWHAQGLSRHTIGIEIAGNFAGIDGNMKTLWRGGGGPHTLNKAMLSAMDAVLEWLLEQFSENGREFRTICAHRQSAPSRIADPGSEIWQKVALPWMERTGATVGAYGFCLPKGRPIPQEWDPRSTGRYWDKPGTQRWDV